MDAFTTPFTEDTYVGPTRTRNGMMQMGVEFERVKRQHMQERITTIPARYKY